MQIYLCTNMQYGKVRERFAEILTLQEGIFSFSWKFNKMWRKCYSIFSFLVEFFCRGNNPYKSSCFVGETIHISAYGHIFESFIIFVFSASIWASGNRPIFCINKAVSVAISLSFRVRLFQPIWFLPCPKRINYDILPFNMLPLITSGFRSFNYIV